MPLIKKKKTNLLYRYVISYLLIFLIPFVLMCTIIYFTSVSSLQKEIEQANLDKLLQVEKTTNEQLKELEAVAAQMSFDQRLTPYKVGHDYYGTEAINELKKYKANNSIITEVMIHYYNDDTIYSSNGSYSPNILLTKKYNFNKEERAKFLEELNSPIRLIRSYDYTMPNEETNKNLISYMLPITTTGSNPYGSVIFFIAEEEISQLIESTLGDFYGNSYILNENKHILASTVYDDAIPSEQINKLPILKNGVKKVRLADKNYSSVSVTSEMTDWTFLTIMETNQFFRKLLNTKMLFLTFATIILGGGIFLAVIFGKYQYRPIRKLMDITTKFSEQDELGNGQNELDIVKRTVSAIFAKHEMLNEKVDKQEPYVRNQMLVKLLEGNFQNNEDIDAALSPVGITMKFSHYFVALIFFEETVWRSEETTQTSFMGMLSDMTFEETEIYGIELVSNTTVAVITATNQTFQQQNDFCKEVVLELQCSAEEVLGLKPTISAGSVYTDKNKIKHSYIEALAALDYKFIKPSGSILCFEEIKVSNEPIIDYPQEELLRLVQIIRQGKKEIVAETFNSLFSALENEQISLFETKCICFEVINTVLKTAADVNVVESIKELESVGNFISLTDLKNKLTQIAITICEEVQLKKEKMNDQLKHEVFVYIIEHYNSHILTLEDVAAQFQLSVSYLNRFIKEQTGMSFAKYVQELRMNEVKRNLIETTKPIKEIIMEVGYLDVPNFTRKFKNLTSLTPGQYRKINVAKNTSHEWKTQNVALKD